MAVMSKSAGVKTAATPSDRSASASAGGMIPPTTTGMSPAPAWRSRRNTSGGHAELVPDVLRRLRRSGAGDIPVVVGGIIPPADAEALRAQGVAAVFTPGDFGVTAIVRRIVDEIRLAHKLQPWAEPLTMKG